MPRKAGGKAGKQLNGAPSALNHFTNDHGDGGVDGRNGKYPLDESEQCCCASVPIVVGIITAITYTSLNDCSIHAM